MPAYDDEAFDGALAQATGAMRPMVGQEVRVTLALADLALARFSMRLEEIQVEPGRLFLSGDFNANAPAGSLYKEIGLPLNDEGSVHVATFAGEVRVETSESFFLEVAPL